MFKVTINKSWLSFSDAPEYIQRRNTPFVVPSITIAELRAAVPAELFKKSTFWGLFFVARAVLSASLLYILTFYIPYAAPYTGPIGICILWMCYCWTQSLVLCGWWCLAHEAGHGNLVNSRWLNDALGFALHTATLTPYFALRESHRKHHKATMSVERDENFCPSTRKEYKGSATLYRDSAIDEELEDGEQVGLLADDRIEGTVAALDIFSDTPLFNLLRIFVMQTIGWPSYLLTNITGNRLKYPAGANHFSPSSPLFQPRHRAGIITSDIGLLVMLFILGHWANHVGLAAFVKLYFIPYILANHHIVLLTYLHHCDPTLVHYRKSQWTFVRGALSTCDRPLYGWIGRVVMCNVSHDHVAHHLFSQIPFWNQPLTTECIKKALFKKGEFAAYNYDSTNTFRALYRTFTKCCFIEDKGDVVFYKNKVGLAARQVAAKPATEIL